jgi:molecular chaperone GrpE
LILPEQFGITEVMNKAQKPQKNPNDTRIAELEQQLQRVAADFDNFRKRTEDEKKSVYAIAQATTLLELTPVLDNFRRATDHLPEHLQGDNWVTGVLYIEKQLEQIFEEHGVTKIKTVGEAFDPQLHEAVSTESSDQPAQTILGELESGYLLGDKVLKPAKVKVSSGPVASTD